MSTKRKTVLVVDDDEGMRDTLTAILKGSYRIKTAANGEEGFAMVAAERGLLLAHGDPAQKHRIAVAEDLSNHELVQAGAT